MELFFLLLGLLLLAFPIIAIVALVTAVGLRDRLRRLDTRLAAIERNVAASVTGAAVPEPPAPATAEPIPPVSQPVAAQPAETAAAPPEPEQPVATPSPATPPPQAAAAAPAGPTAPAMSFEERLGTQWAVWVGGIAVALGGIFLVRYTIEQGLLGPAVRIILAAILAAALIVAGEWARRTERLSGIAGLRVADIPSILTAAGTTIAYADVYAAYALYGFVSPGLAFLLLGLGRAQETTPERGQRIIEEPLRPVSRRFSNAAASPSGPFSSMGV